MKHIVRMTSVAAVLYGVVKIVWRDGYEGLVDLRPVLRTGEVFAFLRDDQSRFDAVALEEHGHYIFWIDDDGDEIEFGTESLRIRSERQGDLLRIAG